MKFLVGCDPEVFVKKDGSFVSAFGLIRGDKKNPTKIRNGAVQVDGMALEFNIDPAKNEKQFVHNVNDVYQQLRAMVPEFEVVAAPVAHFPLEYIRSQPEEARELGCDPDYNAWTFSPNDKPDGERPMRTASGHVHVGWTNGASAEDPNHAMMCFQAARQMDFYLGLPSLMYDDDKERREMYGKAGCLRFKPYGFEYRTLSNAWLRNDKLISWVYRNTIKGMKDLVSGKLLQNKYGDIQEIINSSDKKEAKRIIDKEGIEVCYG